MPDQTVLLERLVESRHPLGVQLGLGVGVMHRLPLLRDTNHHHVPRHILNQWHQNTCSSLPTFIRWDAWRAPLTAHERPDSGAAACDGRRTRELKRTKLRASPLGATCRATGHACGMSAQCARRPIGTKVPDRRAAERGER